MRERHPSKHDVADNTVYQVPTTETRVDDYSQPERQGLSRRAIIWLGVGASAAAIAAGSVIGVARGGGHETAQAPKLPAATAPAQPGEHTPSATATSTETAPNWQDKTTFPFENIGPVTIDGSGNAVIQVGGSPDTKTTGLDAYSNKLTVPYDATKIDPSANPNLSLNNGAEQYQNAEVIARQGLVNILGAAAAYNRNFNEYQSDGYTTSNMFFDAIKAQVDTDPASAGSVDTTSGSDFFNSVVAGVLESGLRHQTIDTITVDDPYVGMVATDERFNDGRFVLVTGNKFTVTLSDGTKTDNYARIMWTNEEVDGQKKWVITGFQSDTAASAAAAGTPAYGNLTPTGN